MVSIAFSDFNSDLILLRKGMQHRLQRPRHELDWWFGYCFELTVTQSYGHECKWGECKLPGHLRLTPKVCGIV